MSIKHCWRKKLCLAVGHTSRRDCICTIRSSDIYVDQIAFRKTTVDWVQLTEQQALRTQYAIPENLVSHRISSDLRLFYFLKHPANSMTGLICLGNPVSHSDIVLHRSLPYPIPSHRKLRAADTTNLFRYLIPTYIEQALKYLCKVSTSVVIPDIRVRRIERVNRCWTPWIKMTSKIYVALGHDGVVS